MILPDLIIQQEQIEKTLLQAVTVYGGYGMRTMPNTIYPPKVGDHKGCPYRCGVASGEIGSATSAIVDLRSASMPIRNFCTIR